MIRLHAFSLGLLGVAGWLAGPPCARAQQSTPPPKAAYGINLDLNDGRQIAATGFRLEGDTLLATQRVEAGTGEIGYPLAAVKKVEFPNPGQLATAANLLAAGKAADALTQIDPIVAYYSPLKSVPGNWWLPAALVKIDALVALRRERESDSLLGELSQAPNNPAAAEAARVRTAESLVRRGNVRQAQPIFDDLVRTSTNPDVLARAWEGKGQILLSEHDYEPALLACLHVPVFYPDNHLAMRPALLNSGRAFAGIDNRDRARESFQHLISDYPFSPEASEAKSELQKLEANPHASSP